MDETVEATGTGNDTSEEVQPRRWVLIAGGLMALGWLLLIIAIAGGGDALPLALLLMVGVAVWWRIKTGPQLGPKAVGFITGAVDSRTADKIQGEYAKDVAHEVAQQVHGGVYLGGRMGRKSATQHRIMGWAWKRWFLSMAGFAVSLVRPMSAALTELRAARAAS